MATILQRLTRALSPTVIRETAKTAGLELELASLHGAKLVSLGPTILRIETAALALVAAITLPSPA